MRRKKEFLIIVLFLVLIFLTQNVEAQTWQATKRLTWNSGYSEFPSIATDSSGNIHVVWDDYTPGNYEIYYKKSTDGGATWSIKRLTWNSGGSCDPTIAIDSSGNIHVVWKDNTPGNLEIYYKKGK